MCSLYGFASGALVVLVLACGLTGVFHYRRLLAYMTLHQPGTFQALGEPQVVTVDGSASDIAAFKFIARKQYLAIGDPKLSALAARIRRLYFVQVALLVSLIAMQAAPGTDLPLLGLECLQPW